MLLALIKPVAAGVWVSFFLGQIKIGITVGSRGRVDHCPGGMCCDEIVMSDQNQIDVQTKIKKNPRPRIREIAPIYLSVTFFNILYLSSINAIWLWKFYFWAEQTLNLCHSYQLTFVLINICTFFFFPNYSSLQISKSICDKLLGTNGKRRKKYRSISSPLKSSSNFYFHS